MTNETTSGPRRPRYKRSHRPKSTAECAEWATWIASQPPEVRRELAGYESRGWREWAVGVAGPKGEDSDDDEDFFDRVASPDAGPSDDPELSELLAQVLAELSDQQREVLALTAEGFTSAEIAERLGTTESAVRVQLHRAREKARRVRH